ncbi:MAG: DNA/RNA non-specific endonuclease [Gemmatimonadaceae bacterium]
MRVNLWRGALTAAFGVAILSCTDPIGPTAKSSDDLSVSTIVSVATVPQLVISQVYGGGGNSGATLKNDFIEVFNPGQSAVSLTGYSVQYNSAGGTGAWQVTNLSGSIPAGGYYLIQEAVGAGGTVNLPTPDATGSIMMAAGAAKVAISNSTAALSGACPLGTLDEVSYGTNTAVCGTQTGTLSATVAALRNGAGCGYTGSTSADFTTGTPAPRNGATVVNVCPAVAAPATTVTIAPKPASTLIGSTQTFTAVALDAANNVVSTTFTWTSSDQAVATINASGVASGLTAGTTQIKVTTANGIADSTIITVTPAPTGDVVISQIYGGGGNSGAPYTNDYIELFNRGTEAANLTGYTVQYTSSTGTSWQATPLSGMLLPGHYYLVQENAGAGTPGPIPTPDATGTISMAGTAGKVLLATGGATTAGISCPTGGNILDHVGYGAASNCTSEWAGATGTLSNTTAAFRKIDGCTKTGSVTNDFVVLPPNPHNSTSTKNCTPTPRPQSTATIAINEIMADPANAESASWGEWFEVRNTGASPVNLSGWTIVTGGTSQPDHVINTDVIVPAGGFAVLGRGGDEARNGGVTLDYNYFVGNATTIWLDDADFLEIVDGAGARVDLVAWTSMPFGITRGLRDASLPHADVNGANWGYSTTVFGAGDYGTPGADNAPLSDVAPIVSANKISVSGRVATDAPLPVGFEAQLFATETNVAGMVIPTTFTWTALTPLLASIDSRGVMHALAPGNARFQVTAADGTARVHTLVMSTPVASATAIYLDNEMFGEPTDADASDDFVIHRPQYSTSFNKNLHTTNWVAYDLNNTDIAPGQDRCNCFTFDPELITAGFAPYNTADYTGAGAFFGVDANGSALHGVDRGHMVRSFDRTAGTLDNARTFYFANVVPQFSDLNQGPWANFENFLGDFAQNQNKEVYIYVGPAGSIGTVKGEGKINFPAWTWKVAMILPRGKGLADVKDYRDVDSLIAVVMPNTFGIRNVDWATNYVVSVDSVERLTGYKFLNLLDARTQRALKTRTKPPLGAVSGPYTAPEGSSINMSGATSVDPNGTIVSYQWTFGDGTTGTGSTVSHTYSTYGSYNVQLTVTDNDGLVDIVTTTASVSDVAPVVQPFSSATLLPGETYTASGTFTDPGVEPWTATVDYGDGSGAQALSLSGKSFSLSHLYASVGTFTTTVGVTDGILSGSGTATITVISSASGISTLTDAVNQLIAGGTLSSRDAKAMSADLDAALKMLNDGMDKNNDKTRQVVKNLQDFINDVSKLVNSGKLTPAQGQSLTNLAKRLIATVSL